MLGWIALILGLVAIGQCFYIIYILNKHGKEISNNMILLDKSADNMLDMSEIINKMIDDHYPTIEINAQELNKQAKEILNAED